MPYTTYISSPEYFPHCKCCVVGMSWEKDLFYCALQCEYYKYVYNAKKESTQAKYVCMWRVWG